MSSPDFETQIHLRSAQSAGAVSVVELAASADFGGPPLHHHDFDEAFYVLEGELTFQLGDELRTAGPGELVFAPRGSHHTLANLSGAPARYRISFNVNVQNLTNRVNRTGFNGTMTSPFFRQPTGITGARKIDVGMSFSF